ncbi:MAG: DUF2846 domain-containing protein [Desulfuromonadaceae bacterium]|nr:DUF2846 domain-containing protein [Desulfuromonadaceae bacterium]
MKGFSVSFFLLATLTIGLLGGCASHTPFAPASIEQDKALVYVFRPNSPFARGEMISINVNGIKQDLLVNNAYLPIQVTPGSTEIKAAFNKKLLGKGDSLTLTTVSGKTYYVKVQPAMAWTMTLTELDAKQGPVEISSKVLYQQ